MATNTSQAYRGNIILEFQDVNNKRTTIPSEQIIYVMIENDYINRVLPVIYMSISVNNEIYNKIINQVDTSYFYLNISIRDALSHTPSNLESVKGLFRYISETTTGDFGYNLNKTNDSSTDTSFRTINIGLVSDEQTKLLRKSFNGIYKDINSSTLIALALENLNNVIVEPLENNIEYKQIIIPPKNSIYRFLEFLYNKDAFYNTPFRFFMDFNQTYLLSQKGSAINDSNNSVIIEVVDVINNLSLKDGIEKINGAYYLYLNQIDAKFTSNQFIPQITDQIIAYDDNVDTTILNLKNNKGNNVDNKTTFVRTDYGNVVKNAIDSENNKLDILKADINGSIFTPDKQYSIIAGSNNVKFNGKYILNYKRTFYRSVDGMYNIACNLGFSSISSNESANKNVLNTNISKAVSSSAQMDNSSDARTTSATTVSRSKYLAI